MESSWHRKVSGSGPVLSALEDEAAVERSLLRKQRAPVREFGSGPTSSALQRTKAIVQKCRFLSERIVGQERPLHLAPVAQTVSSRRLLSARSVVRIHSGALGLRSSMGESSWLLTRRLRVRVSPVARCYGLTGNDVRLRSETANCTGQFESVWRHYCTVVQPGQDVSL